MQIYRLESINMAFRNDDIFNQTHEKQIYSDSYYEDLVRIEKDRKTERHINRDRQRERKTNRERNIRRRKIYIYFFKLVLV